MNDSFDTVNFSGDGKTLEIETAGVPNIYGEIKDLFQDKFGFQIIIDGSTKTQIAAERDEAERFEKFSSMALKIRNDECDPEDFSEFKESTKNIRIELTYFQLLSAYHLAFSQNSLNFSVPGSGKTITTYAAYNYLRGTPDDEKRVSKLVVVGPLSAFYAWRDDYQKAFGARPNYLEIHGGVDRAALSKSFKSSVSSPDLILINYENLNSHKDKLIDFMKRGGNHAMVVLDEAHRIKKIRDGQWSTNALDLAPHAKSRVVLTGTPAPNGYEDLYNLCRFIYPNKNIIGYHPLQLRYMSKNQRDRRIPDLLNKIEPFFIRVSKKDLDLPNPTFHEPMAMPMGPIQQRLYDYLAGDIPSWSEERTQNVNLYQSKLIRLRQVASNPNLLNYSLANYYNDLGSDFLEERNLVDSLNLPLNLRRDLEGYKDLEIEVPEKFKEALRLCQRILGDGGKVLIWCEFTQNILDLGDFMERNGIKARYLYGDVGKEDREEIIDSFHKDENLRLIIANPHAVGESISLHHACHNAIYLEQSFNAGTYMQSKDRIHRLGLDEDEETNYYFLHSAGTVDEVIYRRVLDKEIRMLKVVESRSIPLFTNNADYVEDTESDLKALIRHYYEDAGKMD